MAAVGSFLMGRLLGHSEAEKAFRPWWDSLEDNLIYGLVLVGLIVVPTAIIMGTPLDCNFCQADHCQTDEETFTNNLTDPKFNAWWVKKYCTMNGSVEPFMLYFPYFLLFIAIVLYTVERVFLRVFQAGLKLETFYKFLVKENILGGEQNNKEQAAETTEGKVVAIDAVDGGKEAIEIKQSFKGNNNYFLSYMVRTLLEIIIAGGLLLWIILRGLTVIKHQDTIHCDVHGYWFECSGQPAQFYVYILYITVVITGTYMLLNLYNLLWLTCPCLGKLSRLMRTYRSNMRECAEDGISDRQMLGEVYDIYYTNRDMRLLLDLLATSSGVAPAIAIMMVFDKKFGNAMKPKIRQISVSKDLGLARVEFSEPSTGVRAALSRLPGVNLIYIAEICPPADSAVEGFEFKQESDGEDTVVEEKGDLEMCVLHSRGVQVAVFEGLKQDINYKIKVSTVVNGRTISTAHQEVTKEQERLPVETLDVLKPKDVDLKFIEENHEDGEAGGRSRRNSE